MPNKITDLINRLDSLGKRLDAIELKDTEFREADHPRAENGQFGSGGGATKAKSTQPKQAKGEFSHLRNSIPSSFNSKPVSKLTPTEKFHITGAFNESKRMMQSTAIHVAQLKNNISKGELDLKKTTDPKERQSLQRQIDKNKKGLQYREKDFGEYKRMHEMHAENVKQLDKPEGMVKFIPKTKVYEQDR